MYSSDIILLCLKNIDVYGYNLPDLCCKDSLQASDAVYGSCVLLRLVSLSSIQERIYAVLSNIATATKPILVQKQLVYDPRLASLGI